MRKTYYYATTKDGLKDAHAIPSQVQSARHGERILPLYNIKKVSKSAKVPKDLRIASDTSHSTFFKAEFYDDESNTVAVFSGASMIFSTTSNPSPIRPVSFMGTNNSNDSVRYRHSISAPPARVSSSLPRRSLSTSNGTLLARRNLIRISRFSRLSPLDETGYSVYVWTLEPNDDRTVFRVKCTDPNITIGRWVLKNSNWVFIYHGHQLARMSDSHIEFMNYDKHLETIEMSSFMDSLTYNSGTVRQNESPRSAVDDRRRDSGSYFYKVTTPDDIASISSSSSTTQFRFFDAITVLSLALRQATQERDIKQDTKRDTSTAEPLEKRSRQILKLGICSVVLKNPGRRLPKFIQSLKQVIP